MEPLHDTDKPAHHTSPYRPHRSRWPGLLGAAAIVAAVLGVTMWAQHDDARKADVPLDKNAPATPARPNAGTTAGTPQGTDSAATPPGSESTVAAQPSPQRQ